MSYRRALAVGEQVGRQERDQGDGRGFTPCGRAGGRTQGQLTTFLKIASSTSTLLLSVYFFAFGTEAAKSGLSEYFVS